MPLTRTRRNEGDEINLGDEIYNGLDEPENLEPDILEYELAFGLPEKAVRLTMEQGNKARITFDNGEDKLFDLDLFHKKTIAIHEDGTKFILDDLDGSIELSLDTVYFESIPL